MYSEIIIGLILCDCLHALKISRDDSTSHIRRDYANVLSPNDGRPADGPAIATAADTALSAETASAADTDAAAYFDNFLPLGKETLGGKENRHFSAKAHYFRVDGTFDPSLFPKTEFLVYFHIIFGLLFLIMGCVLAGVINMRVKEYMIKRPRCTQASLNISVIGEKV